MSCLDCVLDCGRYVHQNKQVSTPVKRPFPPQQVKEKLFGSLSLSIFAFEVSSKAQLKKKIRATLSENDGWLCFKTISAFSHPTYQRLALSTHGDAFASLPPHPPPQSPVLAEIQFRDAPFSCSPDALPPCFY